MRRFTEIVGSVLLIALAAGRQSASADSPAEPALNAVGPPLTALPTKIADPRWLIAWLTKPSRIRPGTIMPDSDLSTAEVQAVARYLLSGNAPTSDHEKWRGGDARTGEQLFISRGCRGCHAIAANDTSVSARVPNLAGIGSKVRGDWLFNWIKSPRSYNAHTAMPQLALNDDEIRHLVAFLLTRKSGADIVAAAPPVEPDGDTAAGRTVIEHYECATCHQLDDLPPPVPAFELSADTSSDATLRNGRLLVAYYNCRGCHHIEGSGGALAQYLERKSFAPPTLEGEGRRVQTSWLIAFVQHPTPLRPWLQVRMPSYGLSARYAEALGRYFAALSGVAAADEPVSAASDDAITRGLRRLAHFKCTQCHLTSAEIPQGSDPENLSINFMQAKTRLRPSWIREFLARPKAIVGTQTRMPTIFYDVDGVPKVEQPEQDIEAIVAYLLHMTEPPDATLAKLEEARKRAQPAQPADWSKYEY